MPRRSKRKSVAKKNDKGKESRRGTSSRKIPKRSCRKNQTLLVSRFGPEDAYVTVRLASAEGEEEWDDRSLTSVERKILMTDLYTNECNEDVLPFDIKDLNAILSVDYSGSDAQDGSKAYYGSLESVERRFLVFLG